MSLGADEIDNIQSLLKQQDLSIVKVGLELLDILAVEESDLQDVLEYSKNCISADELYKQLPFKRKSYIHFWALGKLAEFESDWVLKITILRSRRGDKLEELPDLVFNLKQITSLDLRQSGLKQVDGIAHFSNLVNLNLESNLLQELPSEICSILTLQYLNINQNQLDSVPNNLHQLKELRSLSLERNQINQLPESIGYLEKLEVFRIASNPLQSLPQSIKALHLDRQQWDTFAPIIFEMTALHHLNLADFNMLEVPEYIGNMRSLRSLRLKSNTTFLPSNLQQLTELEIFEINAPKLKELPAWFGSLIRLKEIKFYSYYITTLPESLSNLTQLTHLNIRAPQMTILPNWVGSIPRLEVLNIEETKIVDIPDSFCNLYRNFSITEGRASFSFSLLCKGSLDSARTFIRLKAIHKYIEERDIHLIKTIDLSNCNIGSYPQEIEKFQYLENLNLSGNKLSTIPDTIVKLIHLKHIDLGRNQLRRLPQNIFLPNLRELSLYRNKLRDLPDSFFKMTQLVHLNLQRNRLWDLHPSLQNLSNLEYLNIDKNNFTEFPAVICHLSGLKTLSLKTNKITKLPESLAQCTKLKLLALGGNRLPEIPNWIANFQMLEHLCLNGNRYSSLPNLSALRNLQYLGINSKYLEKLPTWLNEIYGHFELNGQQQNFLCKIEVSSAHARYLHFHKLSAICSFATKTQVRKITKLKYNRCNLTELPKNIGNLHHLISLRLEENKISHLPSSIAALERLRFLALDDNLLREIPREIGEMSQLEKIRIPGNPLNEDTSKWILENFGMDSWSRQPTNANPRLKEATSEEDNFRTQRIIIFTLLKHSQLRKVKSGISLLEIMAPDEASLQALLRYPTDCGDYQTLEQQLPRCSNKGYLLLWLLGRLAHFQIPWVLNIDRLFYRNKYLSEIPKNLCHLSNLNYLDLGDNYLNEDSKQWLLSTFTSTKIIV
jgi:Leucine-rich repeat (LRR) protein